MPADYSPLVELFYDTPAALGLFSSVEADDLPETFRSLLAHNDHMTVTLEAWHNSLVDVRVQREHSEGDVYARESLLARQRDGGIVQYGIMRIDLAGLPEIVRLEIESQALPLGRILIRHHVLRAVELIGLWRVNPSEILRSKLKAPEGAAVYARSARILVEGTPAVELLEIVTQ
ncbi:hypothetical protein [Adhaeretor mobilis]|uniref:Uncharacterized protein n=1 Tax=Adhaeretor mobilis TaxID=1930276 RepID=A0A517N1Z5_9BACT|nr:hypothetical protein [Adhaeretor mobilis]QDT01150.1 hypothetical protein HG15A2_44920 [Adhaeretor mobilis]